MDFEDEVTDHQTVRPDRRASLHIELRMPDRHILVSFREAFLTWLSSRGALFGRVAGGTERLSLDEVSPRADSEGMSTLRLSLSWPLGSTIAPVPHHELQSAGAPTSGPVSLTSRDQFVFFPDPPAAAAPLYRELPAVLEGGVFRTPAHPPRITLGRAVVVSAVRSLLATGQLAHMWIGQRGRALRSWGMTVRAGMLARYPRASLGVLGAAAIAAGFVAGSIYLATVDRPTAGSTNATAARGAEEPAGSPAATTAVAEPTGSGVPDASPLPVESPAGRAAAAEERTLRSPVASASPRPQIPDTEVTTRGTPTTPTRAVPPRRPAVVAVRGVEADSPARPLRPQGKGSLLVRSDPQGAQVTVNGIAQGRTPLVIRDLPPGSRVVRVELPGYQRWSWAVGITADRQTPVTVKLQPDSGRSGRND